MRWYSGRGICFVVTRFNPPLMWNSPETSGLSSPSVSVLPILGSEANPSSQPCPAPGCQYSFPCPQQDTGQTLLRHLPEVWWIFRQPALSQGASSPIGKGSHSPGSVYSLPSVPNKKEQRSICLFHLESRFPLFVKIQMNFLSKFPRESPMIIIIGRKNPQDTKLQLQITYMYFLLLIFTILYKYM